ncbi:MAG TPA: ABC transporter permease [Ilumatobacteraceae bacterium]|nr:ABC transporter permease [Ilumatobacteraceae bacterium]
MTATIAPPTDQPDKPRLNRFVDRLDLISPLLLPAFAILSALIVGAVIIALTDIDRLTSGDIGGIFANIGKAYVAIPRGALGSVDGISETLVATTPYVLAGLAVAAAFRAGLFNIGGTGQMLVGGIASVWIGFTMNGPGIIQIPLAILAGIVAGAIWGGISGLLKARTGAHEVITTIMLNYIAAFLILWLLKTRRFQRPGSANPISRDVTKEGRLPKLFFFLDGDYRAHIGFLLAIAATVLMWWLFKKAKLGFELRAFGSNPDAARYAGMRAALLTTVAMAISGGFAGLAGASQILGTQGYATTSFAGQMGFDAIAVALLGRSTASGTFFAGLLFGVLDSGARQMQLDTDIPLDVVLVLRALIVLFIAAPELTKLIWRLRNVQSADTPTFQGWG